MSSATLPHASRTVPAREGPTRQVARYLAHTTYEAVPEATRETAKRLLLDGIGCLLAGTRGEPGRLAADAHAAMAGNGRGGSVNSGGPATIVINGSHAMARDAAFVNGITLYSVGVNDIHKPSGSHPGGCVIPAVLATGEWQCSSGRDMLTAMIAGYDIMGRLGRAIIPSHRNRGFHPTGTFGAFGAAAAVARLLALDDWRTASALGIAGSQAAGLKAFQSDGSLTMIFHAGRSAQNGVEAAVLAQQGFSGPHSVFEDRQGFLAATSDESRPDMLTEALGERFEVDATTFRPYYGCTLTITASGATAQIMQRRREANPEQIARITVRTHPIVEEEVGDDNPQTLLAARLSMQFNIALVVCRGDVLVGDVDDTLLHEPRLRKLLPLIQFETDDSMPRYGSVITVQFKDGSTERAEMFDPKGDPQTPMSWDDIQTKFVKLVEPLGDRPSALELVQMVRSLEHTDGPSLMARIARFADPSRRRP
ncbi:MAG: MmgE/PrpD family protein [Pigmentiphaga sp.]|uniref:MmgE/PrpD family protein n=1 Tax=Pigmentiphaga sp. TaxID=1977564 RepID=UPI0029B3B475|nr:MmgE/PrpD family protein [Pigmentiphaga sp.]MDX3905583.1 MmgE/PrpD family protein [Pigmentiphaga sp.]